MPPMPGRFAMGASMDESDRPSERPRHEVTIGKPFAISKFEVTFDFVAKELARIVYYMLRKEEAFNGTFKGTPLSRTKQPKWPRLASPPS